MVNNSRMYISFSLSVADHFSFNFLLPQFSRGNELEQMRMYQSNARLYLNFRMKIVPYFHISNFDIWPFNHIWLQFRLKYGANSKLKYFRFWTTELFINSDLLNTWSAYCNHFLSSSITSGLDFFDRCQHKAD